jgi:hypothetical protein
MVVFACTKSDLARMVILPRFLMSTDYERKYYTKAALQQGYLTCTWCLQEEDCD